MYYVSSSLFFTLVRKILKFLFQKTFIRHSVGWVFGTKLNKTRILDIVGFRYRSTQPTIFGSIPIW
ncbi:hypothetical protein DP117_27360 [Brasilonema sp. UFV-L1]|nr:hypothetical protein [Brasilonema sp. UFV-L1]